jgi:two-component system KDP operon response regulator KdpE
MPQDKHILVVDDDPSILDIIQHSLENQFKVSRAKDGLAALNLFKQMKFHLVILDIRLESGIDGIEVCRRIRQNNTVPIIMLTVVDDESEKIKALNQGADDYLTKPFSVGELRARVNAVLRRSNWEENPISPGTQRFGNLEIDFEQQCVRRDSELVKLTPTEFLLLRYLALHRGKLCTHKILLQAVWGSEYSSETWYLRVFIGRLRKKLEADPAKPLHILTETGRGYYMP